MKTEVLLLLFSALNNLKAWSPFLGLITILSGLIYIVGAFALKIDRSTTDEKYNEKMVKLEKDLMPTASLIMVCLVAASTFLTIIPDERQMIAIYVVPKLEAGAVEFGKTWGNLPPKFSSLLEAKLDKALKETLGEPNEPSAHVDKRTED